MVRQTPPPLDTSVAPQPLRHAHLLVLDADEQGPCRVADRLLGTGAGDFRVDGVSELADALEQLDTEVIDIVLVGSIDPPCNPVNALNQLRSAAPNALILPLGRSDRVDPSDEAWLGQTLRHITRCRTLAAAHLAGDWGNGDQSTLAGTGIGACQDAVITTDRQGLLTAVNGHAERLTGWPRSQALGQHLAHVLAIRHAVTGETAPNPAEAAIRQDGVIELSAEAVLHHPNGQDIPIQHSAAPIHDSTAAITGAAVVFRGLPAGSSDDVAGSAAPAQLHAIERRSAPGPVAGARATEQLIGSVAQQALNDRGVELKYQPECDAYEGGVQALCVMADSRPSIREHSRVDTPGGARERTAPSGYRVLRATCQQIRHWNDAGLQTPRVSVDASTAGLERLGFASRITEILRETGVEPEPLELVVSQGVIQAGGDVVAQNLATLRELGVRLAISDFGTGYAGLRSLRNLPIETLKLDPRLLRDIATNERARLVVAGMMDLAKRLGYRLIAQGVDTHTQHEFVRDQGCDGTRGHYLARPLSAHDAGLLVAMNHTAGGRASA